jgi:hypothetical protein
MKEIVFTELPVLNVIAEVAVFIFIVAFLYKRFTRRELEDDLLRGGKWMIGKIKEGYQEKNEISDDKYAVSDLIATGCMFYFSFAMFAVVFAVCLDTYWERNIEPVEWFQRLEFVCIGFAIAFYYRVQAGNAWRSFRKR